MTPMAGAGDGLHLEPLHDRLRQLDPPLPEDVLELVDEEHGRWRQLHDRLIGLMEGGRLKVEVTNFPKENGKK